LIQLNVNWFKCMSNDGVRCEMIWCILKWRNLCCLGACCSEVIQLVFNWFDVMCNDLTKCEVIELDGDWNKSFPLGKKREKKQCLLLLKTCWLADVSIFGIFPKWFWQFCRPHIASQKCFATFSYLHLSGIAV
jgi:hypothetical protein